jgi:Protein of unknown function with PCYCGC motif
MRGIEGAQRQNLFGDFFMNRKITLLVLILGLGIVVAGLIRSQTAPQKPAVIESAAPLASHASHASQPARVPAFQTTVVAKDLGPTLAPDKFIGKTRDAYRVAKQIPATLAQLPCYCECDRGYGHKSLHSCFEDEHASHCAVCVDEALLAYQLQTQNKMTPEQVRQRIIEKYSEGN